MLNRYPDQARTRKGFVLAGSIFFCFGAVMFLFESAIGAVIGLAIGSVLVVPSFILGYSAFAKFEQKLSWLSIFGSL